MSHLCVSPIPKGKTDSGYLILFPATIEPVSQLSVRVVSPERISFLLKCVKSPDKKQHLLSIENEFYGCFF